MLRDNFKQNESVQANTAFLNELLEKLPEYFTSMGTFDLEKFRDNLKEHNIDELTSGYQLGWIGKDYAKKQSGERATTVIVPDLLHNQKNENRDSQNLFFTGDNIEVLRHLQNIYANSIDFIYIDPPYNTGSDGFVYPDNFEYSDDQMKEMFGINEEQLIRLKSIQGRASHSAWLTFMYPRLYLAKKLLKDSGVMFVSIDDNEQANLNELLNEIFGESNFVNKFTWVSKPEGRSLQSVGANGTSEVIFAYAKNINEVSEFKSSASKLRSLMPQNYSGYEREVSVDEKGEYIATHELYNGNSIFNEETRPNLVFDIWYRESDGDIKFEEPLESGYVLIEPHRNTDGVHKYNAYRWSKEKIAKESDDLLFVKKGDTYKIFTKRRDFDTVVAKDLITQITTASGGQDLRKLGIVGFDFPKPVKLIKFLIEIAAPKDAVVLDFFAGSGTTAQAVMELNNEDGGQRKFVLATLPELTYSLNSDGEKVARKGATTAFSAGYASIDEISRNRIEKAATMIKENNQGTDSVNDYGFKHFRIVTLIQAALDEIENFADVEMQSDLFDNMVTRFSAESIGLEGGATGENTLLTTSMVEDGYDFDTRVTRKEFAGYKASYVDETRIYLFEPGWGAEQTRSLVNEIGTHQLNVQTLVAYGYSFSMEAIRELEIALNQLDGKVNLQVRY